jgi:threonine dehydratase
MIETLHIDRIREAQERIAPHVLRTPMVPVKSPRAKVPGTPDLYLKLECLQVTGSFKPRGAFNCVLQAENVPGLVASSGGNHGIATAYVGNALGVPVEIPLFEGVLPVKIETMRSLGATADIVGPNFGISNARAKEISAEKGYLYLHPFASSGGIQGQGTIGLEILEDLPDVETVVIAVGGGGLLGGVAAAIKQLRPQTRIIGVEPVGANALNRSLAAGEPVTLDRISTKAATLAPPMTETINLELALAYVDGIVEVTDEEMIAAAGWLWTHCSVATEMAGAAAMAALLGKRFPVRKGEKVCAIACGSGTAAFGI